MECVDQNTEYQLEDMIAESSTKSSKKSFTKLNAKAIPYTSKGKGCTIIFAKIVSRNLDIISNSKAQPAKKK
uniref:Uncharacterized protein n=1 Tax=Rhizophagus irregularis (strain DAOM 181602 / DAOM 197198 / MUCL 43194) TaxID=747089 RepID=U9UK72_RHIID